jgi:hypothetical protein
MATSFINTLPKERYRVSRRVASFQFDPYRFASYRFVIVLEMADVSADRRVDDTCKSKIADCGLRLVPAAIIHFVKNGKLSVMKFPLLDVK